MPRFTLDDVKDTLFRVLFVMRDSPHYSHTVMRNTIILFLIDMCQVLRTLVSPVYGWTKRTYDIAKWIDVVYGGDRLVTTAIPRVSLFAISFVIVFIAVADAVYCFRILRVGEIKSMWPIKALRFLVTVVVTTLYSSVIKWLLLPIECLITEDRESFSEVMRGAGAECLPWSFPEISLTLPTLLLVVLYVPFATLASYFSLGPNALSDSPRHAYTGRVEVRWFATKVAATFLPYLSKHTTSLLAPAVVLVLSWRTLVLHCQTHPFQSHVVNMLRGGVYSAVTWLALWSVVASGIIAGGAEPSPRVQHMQWGAVGAVPVVFACGALLVDAKRRRLYALLRELRGEFDGQREAGLSRQDSRSTFSARDGIMASLHRSTSTARQNFFRSGAARRNERRFSGENKAVAAARVLLRQRVESDESFLAYVVHAGLAEHPGCIDLKVLDICLLRLLLEDIAAAVEAERAVRSEELPWDLQYVIFALEEKSAQDINAGAICKGQNLNVIQVMEFEQKMQKAREAHLGCVTEIKQLWHLIATRRTSKPLSVKDMRKLVRSVESFQRTEHIAKGEYLSLRSKYPTSLQVLAAYASFAHGVLNDQQLYQELEHEKSTIEDRRHADFGAAPPELPTQEEGEEEEFRTIPLRQMQRTGSRGSSFKPRSVVLTSLASSGASSKTILDLYTFMGSIFPRQRSSLLRMVRFGQGLFVLLVAVCVAGFVVSEGWLYGEMAERDILRLNSLGLMRAATVSLTFFCRSLFLAALERDLEEMGSIQGKMHSLSARLQAQHFENTLAVRHEELEHFYRDRDIAFRVVVGRHWDVVNMSYQEMGREVSRFVQLVATMPPEELRAANASARNMTLPQASMAVLNENVFRLVLPKMDQSLDLYMDEANFVWALSQWVVGSRCILDVLLLGMLLLLALSLLSLAHAMHPCYVALLMALSLPKSTAGKLHTHFEGEEKTLISLGDEMAIEDEEVPESPASEAPQSEGEEPPIEHGSNGVNGDGNAHGPAYGNGDSGAGVEGKEVVAPVELTVKNVQRFERRTGSVRRADSALRLRPPDALSRPEFSKRGRGEGAAEAGAGGVVNGGAEAGHVLPEMKAALLASPRALEPPAGTWAPQCGEGSEPMTTASGGASGREEAGLATAGKESALRESGGERGGNGEVGPGQGTLASVAPEFDLPWPSTLGGPDQHEITCAVPGGFCRN